MVSLSDNVKLAVNGIRDVALVVRIENKVYRFNINAMYRRQLYRATSDVYPHGTLRELDKLRFKASDILLKMQALVNASNDSLGDQRSVSIFNFDSRFCLFECLESQLIA